MSLDRDHRQAFRQALGSFATGVTIATTLDGAGEPVGVTASSFNSVSLDPPLVLWSLARDSFSQPVFAQSGHFAIHVLTAAQEQLSESFARSGADKFSGLDWEKGQLGSPILSEYAARFECSTRHQYAGGDHVIMVGEVVDFEARDEAPLLFHGGRYADHRPRPADLSIGGAAEPLVQLLARAHSAAVKSEDPLKAASAAQAWERRLAEEFGDDGLATAKHLLARLEDIAGGS
ncbi:MAG: flavin reductase family protein [Qipengyuania sp.]